MRKSSNSIKGDRFIPMRGTDPFHYEHALIRAQKEKKPAPQPPAQASQENQSASSDSQNNSMQYSRSSAHNQQSFQELMKETLFTDKRGSPESEAQKQQENSTPFNAALGTNQKDRSKSRILSFKEKPNMPSLSLKSNLSVINSIALEHN